MLVRPWVWLMAAAALPARATEVPWPFEPTDADRPVISVHEFMDDLFPAYVHVGVDIPAPAYRDKDGTCRVDAPFAVSPVEGTVKSLQCDVPLDCAAPGFDGCLIEIESADGLVHGLDHLSCSHLEQLQADLASQGNKEIDLRRPLAPVDPWNVKCWSGDPACYPSHLHYDIVEDDPATTGTWVLCPAARLQNYGSAAPPRLTPADVRFVPVGSSGSPTPPPSPACRSVSGLQDIVVSIGSDHRVGGPARPGDQLGPRLVRYKVCGGGDPACEDWAPSFDWARIRSGKVSTGSWVKSFWGPGSTSGFPCDEDAFEVIPTNVVLTDQGPDLDASGAWDTSGDSGHVTVTVGVTDYADQETFARVAACIGTDGAGVAKLLIRDCPGDDGTEPSPCPPDSGSPDVSEAVAGTGWLQACVWNAGSATLPAGPGSRVDVTVGARQGPTGASTVLLLAGIEMSDDPWPPGTQRCRTLPAPTSPAPPGGSLLEMAVSQPGDAPNSHASVIYDNNRAALTGVPIAWPPFRPPTDVRRVDVSLPDDAGASGVQRLSVGFSAAPFLNTHATTPDPALPWTVHVFLGPGMSFEGVTGARLVGTVADGDDRAWNAPPPLSRDAPGVTAETDVAAAGARTDRWRILTLDHGGFHAELRGVSGAGGARIRILAKAWRPEAASRPLTVHVRGFLSGGHVPVLEFDRPVP